MKRTFRILCLRIWLRYTRLSGIMNWASNVFLPDLKYLTYLLNRTFHYQTQRASQVLSPRLYLCFYRITCIFILALNFHILRICPLSTVPGLETQAENSVMPVWMGDRKDSHWLRLEPLPFSASWFWCRPLAAENCRSPSAPESLHPDTPSVAASLALSVSGNTHTNASIHNFRPRCSVCNQAKQKSLF